MIIDKFQNLNKYNLIYPMIEQLLQFTYLAELNKLEKKENYQSITFIPIFGKSNPNIPTDVLEAHQVNIDIHFTLNGVDVIAFACIDTECVLEKEYDVDNDYLLFKSNQIKTLSIPEGYFCIIPNNFAHMALYEVKNDVKKVVVKLPLNQ